jgi:DNA-binding transcriptional LysR family regulator
MDMIYRVLQAMLRRSPLFASLAPAHAAEILLAVVDAGGFAAAARVLGLAQSTISRQVALLETQVGVPLLTRTTRRIALTDAGRFYAERARAGLAALAEAQSGAAALGDEPQGQLRVTMPEAFGNHVVVPMLAAFAAAHPQVMLDLDLSDEVRPLDRGRFDLAIRLGRAAPGETEGNMLVDGRLLLVAAPAWAAAHVLTDPSDLRTLAGAIVLRDPHVRDDWPFRRDAERRHVRVRPMHLATDTQAALTLALAGAGYTVLPNWLVAAHLAAGRLVQLLPVWRMPAYPVRVVLAKPVLTKATAAVEWLRAGMADLQR